MSPFGVRPASFLFSQNGVAELVASVDHLLGLGDVFLLGRFDADGLSEARETGWLGGLFNTFGQARTLHIRALSIKRVDHLLFVGGSDLHLRHGGFKGAVVPDPDIRLPGIDLRLSFHV